MILNWAGERGFIGNCCVCPLAVQPLKERDWYISQVERPLWSSGDQISPDSGNGAATEAPGSVFMLATPGLQCLLKEEAGRPARPSCRVSHTRARHCKVPALSGLCPGAAAVLGLSSTVTELNPNYSILLFLTSSSAGQRPRGSSSLPPAQGYGCVLHSHLYSFLLNLHLSVCTCVLLCMNQRQPWELVLYSSHHVGSGDEIEALRLGDRRPYLRSHPAG